MPITNTSSTLRGLPASGGKQKPSVERWRTRNSRKKHIKSEEREKAFEKSPNRHKFSIRRALGCPEFTVSSKISTKTERAHSEGYFMLKKNRLL